MRGPVGGYVVCGIPTDQPLLLIGGGSGLAPLRSMWRAGTCGASVTVPYSPQTRDRVIFRDELTGATDLTAMIHLTHEVAPGFASGRLDAAALAAAVAAAQPPAVYVCGPTAFVETTRRPWSAARDCHPSAPNGAADPRRPP